MVELLKEQIQEIVHTKEGAQVAMLCLSYSSPKVSILLLRSKSSSSLPTPHSYSVQFWLILVYLDSDGLCFDYRIVS